MKTKTSMIVLEARALELASLPRVDAHLHTSWTDGKGTVAEVYARAVELRLGAILYSEHCRRTSTDWFPAFAAEVRALPLEPCRAFVGAEVKVEFQNGDIDTVPAITDLCDYVMASVHRLPDTNGEAIPFNAVNPAEVVDREFALSWAALANPQVDILGHMFGMSYRRFNAVPSDDQIRALIERAAATRVAVEINTYYHPNPVQMIRWCQEFDALITLGSNAHELDKIGDNVRTLDGLSAS